jgi:hypothetical protein
MIYRVNHQDISYPQYSTRNKKAGPWAISMCSIPIYCKRFLRGGILVVMSKTNRSWCQYAGLVSLLVALFTLLFLSVAEASDCPERVTAQIRLEPHHPWRPPFDLERIGQGFTAVVELQSEERPLREYWLSAYSQGRETERKIIALAGIFSKPPFIGKAKFAEPMDELVLFAKCKYQGEPIEIARQKMKIPGMDAEAIARPEKVINPVDLGAILVPYDWLLLAGGQKANLELAAISYYQEQPDARISAWFDSGASQKAERAIQLPRGKKIQLVMPLPSAGSGPEKDVLHVAIAGADGKEIWGKKIQTMRVLQPPHLPEFGATEIKLRYDAPISVRDPATGALSSMDYATAWDAVLKDVVVSLPNGSRFVFWRGSSYIPFWAGKYDTGMSYEWAETLPPPDGFVDCVEPLMDKELRYSRVEIVESTPARVHVRWRYQSNDFAYKVWGDMPVEDYYFYPDGFGTRVLNLKSAPGAIYEVQEFIILTPQAAFPFKVLAPNIVDILFVDGQKREMTFPSAGEKTTAGSLARAGVGDPRDVPAVYRVRLHKDEPATAISFTPINTLMPKLYGPFYDRGEMVTPFYWGSHWPLARGNLTGMAIDDRIDLSPSHNSIMTWGMNNHTPAFSATLQSHDTLGRAKTMTWQRWYWLIGLTETSDQRLLEWAQSFRNPPSLELQGARLDFDSTVPERRAMRLIVENPSVRITLKPSVRCVNPVFELLQAPPKLVSVNLGDRLMKSEEYAWDGRTLWLHANLDEATTLHLEFK